MDIFDRIVAAWAWRRQVWRAAAPAMGRVLPGVGVVLIAIALGLAAQRWWAQRGLVRASATVIENVAGFAPEGGVQQLPMVRFRDEHGTLQRVVTHVATGWLSFGLGLDVGQAVPVLYPKVRPEQARIAVWWRWYALAIWVGVVGVLVFDLGWLARRRALNAKQA